jgi:hypothetical protein
MDFGAENNEERKMEGQRGQDGTMAHEAKPGDSLVSQNETPQTTTEDAMEFAQSQKVVGRQDGGHDGSRPGEGQASFRNDNQMMESPAA